MNATLLESLINHNAELFARDLFDIKECETAYHTLKALPSLPAWEALPVEAKEKAITLKHKLLRVLPHIKEKEAAKAALIALNK